MPCSRPRPVMWAVSADGVSSCVSSTEVVGASAARASSTCAVLSAAFARGTITMSFCAEASTRMCAMPVGPFADVRKGCTECRGKALGFDAAVTLGPYAGPIRQTCLALKHESQAWLARWVAELVVAARADAIRAAAGAQGDRAGVVAVPPRWRKRR